METANQRQRARHIRPRSVIVRKLSERLLMLFFYFSHTAISVLASEAREIQTAGWLNVLPVVRASRCFLAFGVT